MKRPIGSNHLHAIGLGCMNVSHAYGPALPVAEATQLLQEALDMGYDFFDTASLYGDGDNERLLGQALGHRRDDCFLASKCVLGLVDSKRALNGRPEVIKQHCEDSLSRLGTDRIDLYYDAPLGQEGSNRRLHRRLGGLGAGGQSPQHWRFGDVGGDLAPRPRHPSGGGCPVRVFPLDPQPGTWGAQRLRGAGSPSSPSAPWRAGISAAKRSIPRHSTKRTCAEPCRASPKATSPRTWS